tara:strand:+ start:1588 stop:2601 length:1014 start_codon:yes stop_codon:yes gene_type:complete
MREILLPTLGEAEEQLLTSEGFLAQMGLIELGMKVDEIDWAGVIERSHRMLNKSGSGQHGGTIHVRDVYPLKRTVNLDSHVTLQGASRAMHHVTSSCGFKALQGFEGDAVLHWKAPNAKTKYSNFNAGIRHIHVQSIPGVDGVHFRGAQQSAGIDNLVVRGFGSQATALTLCGDTYAVKDLFLDTVIGGEKQGSRPGSCGIRLPERAQGIDILNATTHNCHIGFEANDPIQIEVRSFETETTVQPICLLHNAMGVTFENVQFRHTGNIMDIQGARWPADFYVKCRGMMVGRNSRGKIQLPNGLEVVTGGKTFDVVVSGDRKGIEVIDLKKLTRQLNQ